MNKMRPLLELEMYIRTIPIIIVDSLFKSSVSVCN